MRRTSAWPQQSFISPIALETSRSQLDSARALHAAAVASLDTTRVGLREAALVAPIGGIVAKRHVVPGEKVSVEQTLLTIVDLRRLGAGRPGGHARGVAPATRHAGAGARRRHAGAGDRAAGAHRAGGRGRHALDRRDDRPRQPEGDAARRPVRAGARGAGRRRAPPHGAAGGRGQHLGPGARVGDRRRRAAAPRHHHRPARRRAAAAWRC